MTENEFLKEKQSVLKTMQDTVCLTKEEAEIMAVALEELLQYQAIGTVEDVAFYKKCHDEESYEFCGEYGTDTCGCKGRLEYLEKQIVEYRAIGTVEECRSAVKRMRLRKPLKIDAGYRFTDTYRCPECRKNFSGTGIADYCYHCGQALDWSE